MVIKAQRHYDKAIQRLHIEPEIRSCLGSGLLQKVHRFGGREILPRQDFAYAAFKGMTGMIHSLAQAIFHAGCALTPGNYFSKESVKRLALEDLDNAGKNVIVVVKSIPAVFWPSIVNWVDTPAQPDANAQVVEL